MTTNKQVTIRLPDDVLTVIDRKAELSKRSRSFIISIMLEKQIKLENQTDEQPTQN